MFDFYYQQGSNRRRLFQAQGTHCSIGSARSNDLVVDTRQIGKRHAELRLEADGIHMRDLGSLSGSWVNRERVIDHGPLSEFDEIEVGDVSLSIKSIRGNVGNSMYGGAEFNGSTGQTSPSNLPHGLLGGLPGNFLGNSTGSASGNFSGNSSSGRSNGVSGDVSDDVSDDVSGDMSVGTSAGLQTAVINDNGAESTENPAVAGFTSDAYLASAQAQADSASSPEAAQNDSEVFDQSLAYWGRIVHEQLLFQMDLRRKDVNRMSDEQLRKESDALIAEIIASLNRQLPETLDRGLLQLNVLNEAVGLGPLEHFLADESITEIMVNSHREIFVERAGKLERSKHHFSSDATVFAVIERIITPLGRRIDESSPIVDARLKDGSRVNAVIPPLALKGPSLTIRKFPKHRLQFSDLVSSGSVDESMVEFLRICVQMRKNIIVSGGTGTGKTTLLNVLSNFIPNTDRIVTIEDAAELKLIQPNLVSLESRPPNLEGKGEIPIRDLVKNALRMRPDRIVVGECRGGEAIDMLQAMNTGHDGSLTTIHANTPRDVLSRLEVLVLMAGMELPVSAIREQMASAVDLIIQQTRFPCGARKITRITEVVGIESGTVQLQDIFRFEQHGLDENHRVRGQFSPTGAIPSFYEELREIGVAVDLTCFSQLSPGSSS